MSETSIRHYGFAAAAGPTTRRRVLSAIMRYKNSTVATTTNPQEDQPIHPRWPDQKAHNREEQRLFSILAAQGELSVADAITRLQGANCHLLKRHASGI